MRKIFIALMMCVASLGFAQESGHMKFMGIPMEGTLQEFVTKLKNKGLTHVSTEDGVAMLTGEFAATKDCIIAVSKMTDTNKVNVVAVFFPGVETWGLLLEKYNILKEMLTEKYGEPLSVEKFKRDSMSDIMKFYAIQNDEATYMSEFSTDNGRIQLSMTKKASRECSVFLRYVDESNAKEVRQRIMDDL